MHAFWLVLTYDLLEDRRIDDDSTRFKFDSCVILWTNDNSLLSIATNQFASFCKSKCYFCVRQSGEIWSKKAFSLFCNRFHVAVRLFSYRSQRQDVKM